MRSDEVVMDISRDWETARDVQQRFMRVFDRAIEALDFGARCRQMLELGGDFYDFTQLPDGRAALAIGDASGKSLAAALMISNVQSSLRTAAALCSDDPAAVLHIVNSQVHAAFLADRYATLFYGVFDAATHTLRYVNGGHNPPIVIRRDGSAVRLESGGAPVGLFSDWTYEAGVIELDPGDWILACTDGVTEVVNPDGEEWGLEGLQRSVADSKARSAGELVDAIFASIDEFSGGRQTDDATVVAFRVR